jgi:hypothetical protein
MTSTHPLGGVTGTVGANFGGATRNRTCVLLVCLFAGEVPFLAIPKFCMPRCHHHNMFRNLISVPLAPSRRLLLNYNLRIDNKIPCQIPPKLQESHFFISIPHKIPHTEVHVYLCDRQKKLQTLNAQRVVTHVSSILGTA